MAADRLVVLSFPAMATEKHRWTFAPRFRQRAFGWKSQPAVKRVKEAVAEIKKVGRRDPILAAEGAVLFLERVSPALEQVDSSSGSIGTAVYDAIRELVPLIAKAPAGVETRQAWLERLFDALQEDKIPYIEDLGDFWGELCVVPEIASAWADELIGTTRMALSPDKNLRGYFKGTSACLAALFEARRYEEILEILSSESLWPYKRWAVKALAALGRADDAISLAENSRSSWASNDDIDALCEEILLSAGRVEEAYESYGLSANRASTYLATFRAVQKKYPHKEARRILADLVATTPCEEGKWFAAAKDLGLYSEAIALARQSPCDPRTLTRAARDFADSEPFFALEAGMTALAWLVAGYGYDITAAEVLDAYTCTMQAAEKKGVAAQTREHIRRLVATDTTGVGFVTQVLAKQLEIR
ncbi:MAG: hypothetical protein AB1486_13240 [Planctomycetota bacterium]